jgi:hypothetical protein
MALRRELFATQCYFNGIPVSIILLALLKSDDHTMDDEHVELAQFLSDANCSKYFEEMFNRGCKSVASLSTCVREIADLQYLCPSLEQCPFDTLMLFKAICDIMNTNQVPAPSGGLRGIPPRPDSKQGCTGSAGSGKYPYTTLGNDYVSIKHSTDFVYPHYIAVAALVK